MTEGKVRWRQAENKVQLKQEKTDVKARCMRGYLISVEILIQNDNI